MRAAFFTTMRPERIAAKYRYRKSTRNPSHLAAPQQARVQKAVKIKIVRSLFDF